MITETVDNIFLIIQSASYQSPEEMATPGRPAPQPIGWAPGQTPPNQQEETSPRSSTTTLLASGINQHSNGHGQDHGHSLTHSQSSSVGSINSLGFHQTPQHSQPPSQLASPDRTYTITDLPGPQESAHQMEHPSTPVHAANAHYNPVLGAPNDMTSFRYPQ